MIGKMLRAEERLEIVTGLLTDEQVAEYEHICKNIESQREQCGLLDIPVECVLHLLSEADKRMIGCPCVS